MSLKLKSGNQIAETYTLAELDDMFLNKVYPVGAVYISMTSTNPGTLFGGTWEQIQGRFLLAVGANTVNTDNTYGSLNANAINRPVGEQGGEVTHTLSVNEMPSHAHPIRYGSVGSSSGDVYASVRVPYNQAQARVGEDEQGMQSVGGGQAHNNVPPYIAVYMWRRTA
jgi:microcystin-dependent protein